MKEATNNKKQSITIELPDEFISLCEADNIEPILVVRGFIADLCGIMNWAHSPRQDGYGSNGSDERMKAQEYYQRVGYQYWKEWGKQ